MHWLPQNDANAHKTQRTAAERPRLYRRWDAGRHVQAGDKLPTERALADQFRTGRSRVRGVLAELANDRRVVRSIGRGTFVAVPASDAALEREATLPASPAAVMDARLALESAIISLVVRNATQLDFVEMARCVERAGRAKTLNALSFGTRLYTRRSPPPRITD